MKYGIYLGTTSASIARMEKGMPVIVKTNSLKDTMPICAFFNKKGSIQVGDSAFNAHRANLFKNKSGWGSSESNSFIGFTRTLGTDKTYFSSNANKSFTSTELVTEILKALCSFVIDNEVKSAVITVPANYRINQIDAVREAGKLAGIQQVEILQEPIAVSLAYGLDSIKYQGFSLVFSFKEDIFDVSLMKKGVIIDKEGDNYLGGQNLDFAIVDEIILPYIEENFVIDSILADDNKKQILRNILKYYAEDTKVKLSFNETYGILSNVGDVWGEDDEGEEIELDITVTQDDITRVLAPVFQKAIDISLNLLKSIDLDALVLVGGDTFSPVLRRMLESQICKPDTSNDPKTAIVLGAALYASTIDVSNQVRLLTRDKTKIQLEISHESVTVEMEEWVSIKILVDKTEREIPSKVFAEFERNDNVWLSGKTEINSVGEVIEVALLKDKTNVFDVVLYDDKRNRLECEPNSFSIKQGSKIGNATLPYNIGIEIKQKTTGKIVFSTIKGLEKNQFIPAVGTVNGIKTKKQIRPGNESDFITISIYEGDYGAEGTRVIYNHHVSTIRIDGSMLPALLPANSDVDLTVNVDRSERITVTAFFPYLDYSTNIEIESNRTSLDINAVEDLLFELTENEHLTSTEFKTYFEQLSELKDKMDIDTLSVIYNKLKEYGRKA